MTAVATPCAMTMGLSNFMVIHWGLVEDGLVFFCSWPGLVLMRDAWLILPLEVGNRAKHFIN